MDWLTAEDPDFPGKNHVEVYVEKQQKYTDVVEKKQKSQRAEMERRILKMVDHPFLPTLYAEFEASHFSCIVMEYCSGGDLHSLRHKQPNKRFSLAAAR